MRGVLQGELTRGPSYRPKCSSWQFEHPHCRGFGRDEVLGSCEGGRMTPEELKTKLDELRTLIVEKLAELEEDPKLSLIHISEPTRH